MTSGRDRAPAPASSGAPRRLSGQLRSMQESLQGVVEMLRHDRAQRMGPGPAAAPPASLQERQSELERDYGKASESCARVVEQLTELSGQVVALMRL